MKAIRLALLALVFTLSSIYAGQTFTYPEKNPIFEITYPEGWEIEEDGDSITASPASGNLSSVLMAVAGDDLESALEGAGQGLEETFGHCELSEAKEGQLNGMPVLFFNGKGKTPDGVALDLGCAIFTPNGETFFMLFIFSSGELSEEDTEKMNSILQSIKAS